MGAPVNPTRFAPGRRLFAATQRALLVAIGFFAVFRLLIAAVALTVFLMLADAVTDGAPAVAAGAVALPALVAIDGMLERARQDLVEARRASLWAAARADQRGGASAAELLAGFRLFDRWGSWLTRPGRKLARERSLALLSATFDRAEDGQRGEQLARVSRRTGGDAAFLGQPGRTFDVAPGA